MNNRPIFTSATMQDTLLAFISRTTNEPIYSSSRRMFAYIVLSDRFGDGNLILDLISTEYPIVTIASADTMLYSPNTPIEARGNYYGHIVFILASERYKQYLNYQHLVLCKSDRLYLHQFSINRKENKEFKEPLWRTCEYVVHNPDSLELVVDTINSSL